MKHYGFSIEDIEPLPIEINRRGPAKERPKKDKLRGIVKWYSFWKEHGFISGEDGQDYYFHESSIVSDSKDHIIKGLPIRFEVIENERGPRAKNVSAAQQYRVRTRRSR